MPSVTVYNDNFEKAMRKFRKKVSNAKILEEYRGRQFYEKPSIVRKRKQAAAKARLRKKLRTEQNPKKLY